MIENRRCKGAKREKAAKLADGKAAIQMFLKLHLPT